MKKGMVSFFLVFLMLFSVVPAAFASGEGLSNFKTVNAYTNGQFADVASGTWFADSVKTAYELGLVPVSYTHLDVYKRQVMLPPVKNAPRIKLWRQQSYSKTPRFMWWAKEVWRSYP